MGSTTPSAPPGLHPAAEHHRQLGLLPDVPVRCRCQDPDAPPVYSRDRFGWSAGEIGGAFGDLGTFIPHVVAAVVVVGMAPGPVLAWFGVYYVLSGAWFGVPLGVQPMKAVSAAVLVELLTPGEVAAAGLVLGAFFLVVGLTRVADRLARLIPDAVTAGIQVGLGLALALLGLRLMGQTPWLGITVATLLLLLLRLRGVPAALVALVAGVAMAALAGLLPPLPETAGLRPPAFVWPTAAELRRGVELAVLPQIPLTLTNALIVAAAVARQLFPKEEHRVSERSLALSMGVANLLVAPLGGYPMCHGAGGMAAHHRFGARTATAPLVIGAILLVLGVALGPRALQLMALIPNAVVGALLLLAGLELAASARPLAERADRTLVLFVAVVTVAGNPAVAFALGLLLAWALRRRLIRW